MDNVDKLDLKGVCSILHSYGYMKYRDRNLLEILGAKLIENIRVINSSQISSVLRAYSILKFRSDFLFLLMIPEISLRLDMMNVSHVSSIFYSYSNLGYYNKNLFQSIQTYLYGNLDKMKPYDLTLLLTGQCKNFRGFDERFLTVLSFQFCKLLDSFDNKLFSLAVNSLSRLNYCNNKYLPSLIESEVYNRVKMDGQPLQSKSLSLILNAISRHHNNSTPLFTFLAQTVLKRLKEFDLHSLCLVLSAFSRVSLSDGKTYDKIAEYVGRNSLKLYPRAIASMIYSYGQAKHLHGALFYFSGKHLEINPGSYTCDEIGMILRSFSVLNVKNEELLESLSDFIVKNTPDYVPGKFEDLCYRERVSWVNEDLLEKDEESEVDGMNINLLEFVGDSTKSSTNFLSNGKIHSLLWIVQAYSKFFFLNDQVLKAMTRVANELVFRMNELTPFLVARFLFSFSQLNFRHGTCLEMLQNEVSNPRKGFKFNQKDLSLIHYSAPSFGHDPSEYGVYRFNRMDFQNLVEKHRNTDTKDTSSLIRRLLAGDVPSSKPLYLELLPNPLKLEEELTESLAAKNSLNQTQDLENPESDSKDKEDYIYVHIPKYVEELVRSGDPGIEANTRLAEALDSHIKYNFNID